MLSTCDMQCKSPDRAVVMRAISTQMVLEAMGLEKITKRVSVERRGRERILKTEPWSIEHSLLHHSHLYHEKMHGTEMHPSPYPQWPKEPGLENETHMVSDTRYDNWIIGSNSSLPYSSIIYPHPHHGPVMKDVFLSLLLGLTIGFAFANEF